MRSPTPVRHIVGFRGLRLDAHESVACPSWQCGAQRSARHTRAPARRPSSSQAGAPPAGRGGQQLSSATPLTETENLDAYPAPPEGFNVVRDNIPHGEVKIVERLQDTSGCAACYGSTPPPTASFPCCISSTAWATPAPNGRSGLRADHHRQPAGRKKIQQPFIIVFPSGNATATMADEKQGDRTQESYGAAYQQDLLKEIIPFVESQFSGTRIAITAPSRGCQWGAARP